MKIVVVGSTGMLGKRVVKEVKKRRHEVFELMGTLGEEFVFNENADVIINCAGKIPPKNPSPEEMIKTNSVGPWQLAERLEGMRLIHMSTDCVFSGETVRNDTYRSPLSSKIDLPDPIDLYGRSKLAGEPFGKGILVVRGSFIGPDHGFFKWVVEGNGSIEAWQGAEWNGGSVGEMARTLVYLAEGDKEGIVHVGAEKGVTKAWIIEYLINALGLEYEVKIVNSPEIHRVLLPDIFLQPVIESLDELIAEME